jgi:hypothetical protein
MSHIVNHGIRIRKTFLGDLKKIVVNFLLPSFKEGLSLYWGTRSEKMMYEKIIINKKFTC